MYKAKKSKVLGICLLLILCVPTVIQKNKDRIPIINQITEKFNTSNIKLENEQNSSFLNVKYSQSKYPENIAIINNNTPVFGNDTKQAISYEKNNLADYLNADDSSQNTKYSGFDSLGRTQAVSSFIREKDVLKHSSRVLKRPVFPASTKISGEYSDGHFDPTNKTWTGTISNNRIIQLSNYRGFLYNKSHLLAWSLGGSMDSVNVILGTRAQNVGHNDQKHPGGMAYYETKVREFLKTNPKEVVFYKAIPIYSGNELVPRGVHVLAQSVNNPKLLNLNVWVFNTQAGVSVNYLNGSFNSK